MKNGGFVDRVLKRLDSRYYPSQHEIEMIQRAIDEAKTIEGGRQKKKKDRFVGRVVVRSIRLLRERYPHVGLWQ